MLAVDSVLQGRYQVLKPVEQGGMGTVYEALDLRLLTTVALKEAQIKGEQLRRQFEREARMLAHLRHPALTKVFDHFTEGERQFLVMEYIRGEDLSEMMRNRGRAFHPLEVVGWADQLLDALEYLHTHEPPVVHRDIKPSNLRVTDRGQIVLLDFGLAKGGGAQHGTQGESVIGYTLHYAPLEQIQGAGTSPRSDLYSLGATLYHLLTNEKPPDALTRVTAVIASRPDPLTPATHLNEHVTNEFAAVLARALALNPDERPGSAAEMRRQLREASATLSEVTVEQAGDALLPSQRAQLNYWAGFREYLSHNNSSLHMEVPRPQNSLRLLGDRDVFSLSAFAYTDIRQVGVSLGLRGPLAEARFNQLLEVKEAVERELGYALRWDAYPHISRYEAWVALDDTDPADQADWPRQHAWLREKLEGMLRVFTSRAGNTPAAAGIAAETPGALPPPSAGDKPASPLRTSPLDVAVLVGDAPAAVPADVESDGAIANRPGHRPKESRPAAPGHVGARRPSRAARWVVIISLAAALIFSAILAFVYLSGRRTVDAGGASWRTGERPARDAQTNIADVKVSVGSAKPDEAAPLARDSVIYILAKINSQGRVRVRGRLLVDNVAGSRQGAGVPGADTTVELLKGGTATFKFAPVAGWRGGSYVAEVTLHGERGELKDVGTVSFVVP